MAEEDAKALLLSFVASLTLAVVAEARALRRKAKG